MLIPYGTNVSDKPMESIILETAPGCLSRLNLREEAGPGQYLNSSTQDSLQLWGGERLL